MARANGVNLFVPIIANIALVAASSSSLGLLPAAALSVGLLLSATALSH
ncbi:hypothetical protein IMCC21906_01474 [Spongiibacter sp. IMCC21906]|jgi:hypothetical protein|nr:hypothetical protein IMCC21906_01474 [Spongiibacter sp. IMCC21906]